MHVIIMTFTVFFIFFLMAFIALQCILGVIWRWRSWWCGNSAESTPEHPSSMMNFCYSNQSNKLSWCDKFSFALKAVMKVVFQLGHKWSSFGFSYRFYKQTGWAPKPALHRTSTLQVFLNYVCVDPLCIILPNSM